MERNRRGRRRPPSETGVPRRGRGCATGAGRRAATRPLHNPVCGTQSGPQWGGFPGSLCPQARPDPPGVKTPGVILLRWLLSRTPARRSRRGPPPPPRPVTAGPRGGRERRGLGQPAGLAVEGPPGAAAAHTSNRGPPPGRRPRPSRSWTPRSMALARVRAPRARPVPPARAGSRTADGTARGAGPPSAECRPRAPGRQSAPVPSGWGMLAAPRNSDSPRGIGAAGPAAPAGRRPPHPLRPPPCACGARSVPMVPVPPVPLFPSPPGAPPAPLPPLLAGLPAAALARLRPHLRRVALPQGLVLYEPGEPIADAYLPAAGGGAVVSLLAVGEGDEAVEAGLVGAEGLVGLPAVLGAGVRPPPRRVPAPGPRLAPARRRLRRGGRPGRPDAGPAGALRPGPAGDGRPGGAVQRPAPGGAARRAVAAAGPRPGGDGRPAPDPRVPGPDAGRAPGQRHRRPGAPAGGRPAAPGPGPGRPARRGGPGGRRLPLLRPDPGRVRRPRRVRPRRGSPRRP